MLNNIIQYILDTFYYIFRACLFLIGLTCEGVMFLAMFICGTIGFSIFLLFLGFMLSVCCIALFL
jgi:hypothetical protein